MFLITLTQIDEPLEPVLTVIVAIHISIRISRKQHMLLFVLLVTSRGVPPNSANSFSTCRQLSPTQTRFCLRTQGYSRHRTCLCCHPTTININMSVSYSLNMSLTNMFLFGLHEIHEKRHRLGVIAPYSSMNHRIGVIAPCSFMNHRLGVIAPCFSMNHRLGVIAPYYSMNHRLGVIAPYSSMNHRLGVIAPYSSMNHRLGVIAPYSSMNHCLGVIAPYSSI